MRASHVVQESWRAISRNRAGFLLATSVQAVCLMLLAVFAVVALNLTSLVSSARQHIELHVFLTPDADASAVQNRINQLSAVERSRFVSSLEALEDLRTELGEDASVLEVLEANPLPPSIRVTLATGAVTPEALAELETKIGLLPGVSEVWSGSESLARLDRLLRIAVAMTIAVLVLVSLSVAFIVFQTVESSIVTRAREIEIMELVGATWPMVRAPFALEGIAQGVIGGVVAFGLVFALYRVAASVFPEPVFPVGGVAALCLGLGAFLGFLGSMVALGRISR